jgi:hypothetical protein
MVWIDLAQGRHQCRSPVNTNEPFGAIRCLVVTFEGLISYM